MKSKDLFGCQCLGKSITEGVFKKFTKDVSCERAACRFHFSAPKWTYLLVPCFHESSSRETYNLSHDLTTWRSRLIWKKNDLCGRGLERENEEKHQRQQV